MDDITTRTIVIAVNIFITIMIVSIIVIMYTQMQDIYGIVADTETSMHSNFEDIYSVYDGRVVSGVGLLNAIKKYEDKPEENVTIKYPGSYNVKEEASLNNKRESAHLKQLMENHLNDYAYENKYNVSVTEDDNHNITIEFIKIG